MKFEEIEDAIKNRMKNSYERNFNIETLNIKCVLKKDNIALFVVDKSDNSKSVFIVRKTLRAPEDKWSFPFCPSEEEAEVYGNEFYELYKKINEYNKFNRKNDRRTN